MTDRRQGANPATPRRAYNPRHYVRVNFKTAGFIGTMLIGAAWLFADTGTSSESARTAAPMDPTGVSRALHDQMRQETERLRRSLGARARLLGPQRDPFAFAAPSAASPSGPKPDLSGHVVPNPIMPDRIARAPDQHFDLLGIGEERRNGEVVRTVIIGGPNNELWLLKNGEMLGLLYRIGHITDTGAELVDISTGIVTEIALR